MQNPKSLKDKRYQRIKKLAWVLDESIQIPGTTWRIGWDAILGLIPGVGDVVGYIFSLFVLFESYRLGVSGWTLTRQLGNVLMELFVGIFPGLGDIFDFFWKANSRNLKLLELEFEGGHGTSHVVRAQSKKRVLLFAGALIIFSLFSLSLFAFLLVQLFQFLLSLGAA